MARADHPPLHCLRLYQKEKKRSQGIAEGRRCAPPVPPCPPGSLPPLGPPAPTLGVSKTRWEQRDVPDPVRWIGDLPRSLVPKLGSSAWGEAESWGGTAWARMGLGLTPFSLPPRRFLTAQPCRTRPCRRVP